MAAYQAKKADFDALEATIYAASVDTLEQAQGVAGQGFTFPIAYGVTIEESETFGAWPAAVCSKVTIVLFYRGHW